MSSDSSTGKSPPKKKNVKYEQKFVNSWLKDDRLKGWLKKNTKRPQNNVVDRNHQAMSNLNSRRPAPMLHQPLRPLLQVPYPYAELRNSALIATELAKK
ncbi:hypothetical protein EVAR_34055_1 [Eumeta japonica]|uniref:Uncharacterized protein n=1 Tax=Eumeta variegata TaxID=151549 RepID=A0A4C1VTE0_EUMVA|nr:hypothetical protein EVAR_34055_1 [Eumeta japonica]